MTVPITLRLSGRVAGTRIPNTFHAEAAGDRLLPNQQYHVLKINGNEIPASAIGYSLTIRRIRSAVGERLIKASPGKKVLVTVEFLVIPPAVEDLPVIDNVLNIAHGVDLELERAN